MSILFLLASLGVINGFVLGIFLLSKRGRIPAELFFAGLLIALGIRIGKSVLYYFNPDLDILVRQIGLSACVFVGPLFYLAMREVRDPSDRLRLRDLSLLIFLALAIFIVGLLVPYSEYPHLWNLPIIKAIYAIWVLFTALGINEVIGTIRKHKNSPKFRGDRQYLVGITIGMVFITATYQIAYFIDGVTYLWGSLIFTSSFYFLAIRVLAGKHLVLPRPKAPIPSATGQSLIDKIEGIMLDQKPFRNPKLKLDELAELSGLSRHELSKILNEVYTEGFSHYIKEHRVREAQKLISNRHDLSLEGIGYEAGFNSKSSFFEAFKKIVGQTPSAYKKSLIPSGK